MLGPCACVSILSFRNEVPEPSAGEMPGPAGHVLLSEE